VGVDWSSVRAATSTPPAVCFYGMHMGKFTFTLKYNISNFVHFRWNKSH